MKVGFAGSGNMAAAVARGWASARDGGGLDQLLFTDAGSGRAERLAAELGGEAVGSNRELAERSDLLVLAVKPASLDDVGAEVRAARTPVLSLLGATPLQRVRDAVPGVPVIRVLPNVAVEVHRGVLCWAAAEDVPADLRDEVVPLLALLGTEIELEDRLMDAATAVMSCSPAYVALFAEALIDAGVREGIAHQQAALMVKETFAGTAMLLERDTLSVRRSVTSPGGSTAAGLAALERASVRAAIAEAVSASLARMRE
jgi:pyrroline-5-carboxylate reductase